MLSVLVCCVLLAVVRCEVQYQHPEEWDLWKTEHGKSYQSQREELERHLVWLSNREYINAHNANSDIFGFTLSMNHFGDISDTEFESLYLSKWTHNKTNNYTKYFKSSSSVSDHPSSIDWRTKGAVSDIKNQVLFCCSV
ncbi:Silicatein [Geodia barretti]|uniref:Silicatein n=1 Tax=Geodia barretti TaxID=519541 RepID=A0AA35SPJ8_GEOBA|nr:Silicatein [Geodia barretti]